MIPGRWFIRHRDHPSLKGFVRGATAAAAGAIAGAITILIRQTVVDFETAAIALVALGLLWKFKIKEPIIVLLAAAAGVLLR